MDICWQNICGYVSAGNMGKKSFTLFIYMHYRQYKAGWKLINLFYFYYIIMMKAPVHIHCSFLQQHKGK